MRRKVTYKLYPNATQAAILEQRTNLHCELYNAALEERIGAYKKSGLSISYYDQQNTLPQIKMDRPELIALGSHALQETLRRLDRAFAGFFRRVKAGQKPGFPRFKSRMRYPGFAYPDPAGWKVLQNGNRGVTLRLGSRDHALMIRGRGQHRFGEQAKPNDITLSRRHGQWYASMTLRVTPDQCARVRTDTQVRGMDMGNEHWAIFDNGQRIDNPRWLRRELPALADLQRARAKKKRGSGRYRRLSARIVRLHQRVANCRLDFIHKKTSEMVQACTVLATETLQPKNMSRSARGTRQDPEKNVRQKAGLNREILSVGYAMTHQMLKYKAEEAGTYLHLANTRQLKPSQRCSGCWEIVRKPLSQRQHECPVCGVSIQRDRNSALVVLIDALSPGAGDAARDRPLCVMPLGITQVDPMTRETPTTSALRFSGG